MHIKKLMTACVLTLCLALIAGPGFAEDAPMLRYERASAMINEGRPVVRLDVWADGTARAWFFEFSPTPGEYTFKLAPDRLAALQSAVGSLEKADFDSAALEQEKEAIIEQQREAAAKAGRAITVTAVSDDTFSGFGINPTGVSSKLDSLNAIRLTNLPQLSQQYKSIDALQRWQTLETLALQSLEQAREVAKGVRDESQ